MGTNQETREAVLSALSEILSGAKATGFKHDPTVVGSIAPYSHGLAGLFSTPGQHPNVISAMHLPSAGLLSTVPVMPPGTGLQGTDTPEYYGGEDTPLMTTITGVTAGAVELLANQRATPCGDAPLGGLLKACTITRPYGRFAVRIRQLDVRERNRLLTYAEPQVVPVNNPLINPNVTTPSVIETGGWGVLNEELVKRAYEAALSMQRWLAQRVWVGTPLNNNVGGGYREFVGMDLLININNKIDAFTGNVCTAMNSYLYDFGNDLVNGTGRDIVAYMDTAFNQLTYQARRNGVEPVEWVIYMRPELFDELVKVWPVRYYQEALLQMANFANGQMVVMGTETTQMRDDMRNNMYLPIRGRRLRVVTDDAIAENTQLPIAGQYSSDIYFVPMRILGNYPVFYWETFKYRAEPLFPQEYYAHWTTDDRRFLWTKNEHNGCIEYTFELEPRLILRTPQLAARIQNVAYAPLEHYRSAYPTGDTADYFLDGGRTNSPISLLYTEYSTATPVRIPGYPTPR